MSGLLAEAIRRVRGTSSSGKTKIVCAMCSTSHGGHGEPAIPQSMVCSSCKNKLQPQPPASRRTQSEPVMPRMSTFIATIPPNVHPGEKFRAILNGQERTFTCPPGAGPGSRVKVLIETTPIPTAPLVQRRATSSRLSDNGGGTKGGDYGMFPSPEWSCLHCSFTNKGIALACGMCSQTRNTGGKISDRGSGSKSAFFSSSIQNICKQCTYENKPGATKCALCGQQLGVNTNGEEQKQAASHWRCSVCTLENLLTSAKCAACGTESSTGGGGGGGGGIAAAALIEDPHIRSAYECIEKGDDPNKIRKMLKEKYKLSTGKAQKALAAAKRIFKKNTENSEGKLQPLRVPSMSTTCGMCHEKIQRGDSYRGYRSGGNGTSQYKASTSATCLCEHYFCFDCLGKYVKNKIISAEVKEGELDCPEPSCTMSMLQDPLRQYTPNYLFTQCGGKAEGILGRAFTYKEACELNIKFLNHTNRNANLFITCPNPRCEIKVYVEENIQFFTCEKQYHGCGKSFCKLCRTEAHGPIKDCKQAKLSRKADAKLHIMTAKVLAEGGRYCPKCRQLFAAVDKNGDPNPDKWECDHMKCGACKHQYCRNCGADRKLILDNDNSWHVRGKCGLWSTYEGEKEDARKPKDWPAVWKELDPQFNGKGAAYFDVFSGTTEAEQGRKYKQIWSKLGTLKTKLHPTQGYFRKCQHKCGCSYGNGHSKFWELANKK
jgi:hypothetical protein